MDEIDKFDYLLKIIIIGDNFVGKTSLCNRLTNNNTVDEIYDPTIGVDLYCVRKNVCWLNWKIHLWDTSGYAGFHKILEEYYKQVAVCILIFDITDNNSFEFLKYKMNVIKKVNPEIYFVIVANKIDRFMNSKPSKEYYKDYFKNIPYYETSAISNISGLLESIIGKFYKQLKKENIISKANGYTNIKGLKIKPKNKYTDKENIRACLFDCEFNENDKKCNIL